MKKRAFFLMVAILARSVHAEENEDDNQEQMDPNNHLASDHQLVIRSAEGGILVGTDSGDHFTAEARDKDNEVKGVYSWIDPRGESHTVTYTSGKQGYKTLPLKKSGLDLPPFPYSLYGTPPKEQIQPRELDEGPKLYTSPKGPNQSDQPKDIVEYDEFIVISPDEDEVAEANNTSSGGVAAVVETPDETANQQILIPGDLLGGLQITLGTPVAASRPSATAVAGDKGTAQVSPSAQAFVGPGGVAIAFPSAQAAVGPNGISISRPIAVSSAGNGGVAIAGGISTAFAGIESGPQKVLYGAKTNPNLIILPIVANYYFQGQAPITADSPGIFQQRPAFYPPYPYKGKTVYGAAPKSRYFYDYGYADKTAYSARSYDDLIKSAD